MADGGPTKTAMHLSHWGAYRVDSRDGRLVGVSPFEGDPEPSPLIQAMPDVVHHECRIAEPMVRQGFLEHGAESDGAGRGVEPFVPVSWDRALDLVAAELARVKSEHGNNSIYGISGWGSAGVFHAASEQLKRFLNRFGGYVDQVTNYSFGAASVILPRIVGSMEPVAQPTAWPTIVENTQLMLLFGGIAPKNSQLSKHGVIVHETQNWLRKARDAGMSFVQVSPIKDDMAGDLSAEWLAARPGSDVAIMLGLAHTLLVEELHDPDFLARYCVGFEKFSAYLLGDTDGVAKDADWAAALSELDADNLRQLARRMAAGRTMISVSYSVQRGDHGEQPCWAAIALAAMLGQIGLPGGGFGIGYGSNGHIGEPSPRIPQPGLPTGANRAGEFIPVARVVDMLLNPGESYDFNGETRTYPDIRLIYWCGGNPFHKQQDINRFLRAWQRPETIIVHEPWWTAAARRADIVLPATTTLERNDIGAAVRDRYFVAMQQAIPPVGNARNEYDIYTDLAERLGFREAFTDGRSEMDWLRHMYEESRKKAARRNVAMPDFDQFWDDGHLEFSAHEEPPILFGGFREDPANAPLKTPSGKIEIFSETIHGFNYDDCPGHPAWLEPAEWLGSDKTARHPLHMLSNQPRHRLHSQRDFSPASKASKIGDREPVQIHPDDAAARGISDGDIVRLYNDRGACLAGAIVTDAIRPGVVCLSTGAWFDPIDPSHIGSLDKHGNPNVLTLDKGTSKLAQTCSAQSTLIEMERYEGDPPAITAFDLPVTVGSD
ncbi:MAG: molybdopterin guanine dinucleotide-containing S/N-oxide reductase [Rhodospirillaceae bacterium]|nr:molybdopterin guanine dinucleotide-containing S/N-oxide reductase [Rhodospirillaceae bacterium]